MTSYIKTQTMIFLFFTFSLFSLFRTVWQYFYSVFYIKRLYSDTQTVFGSLQLPALVCTDSIKKRLCFSLSLCGFRKVTKQLFESWALFARCASFSTVGDTKVLLHLSTYSLTWQQLWQYTFASLAGKREVALKQRVVDGPQWFWSTRFRVAVVQAREIL